MIQCASHNVHTLFSTEERSRRQGGYEEKIFPGGLINNITEGYDWRGKVFLFQSQGIPLPHRNQQLHF